MNDLFFTFAANMAKILLIETATDVCSAAIALDGKVLALEEQLHCLNHAAVLTLQIQACCQKSGLALPDLDAVALSQGPGSYTALRVGTSVAKGICYALDKPLIAVDTLRALAHAAEQDWPEPNTPRLHFPMLDARRNEVWAALYDEHLNCLMPAQPIVFDAQLNSENEPWATEDKMLILSGNGAVKAEAAVFYKKTATSAKKNSSASFLAESAERAYQMIDFQDIAYFSPLYMKQPNITVASTKL